MKLSIFKSKKDDYSKYPVNNKTNQFNLNEIDIIKIKFIPLLITVEFCIL